MATNDKHDDTTLCMVRHSWPLCKTDTHVYGAQLAIASLTYHNVYGRALAVSWPLA